MNNKFLQALYRQKKQTEQRNPLIAGSLGITINGFAVVEVPDRPSYVYVQVRSSTAEVIQAFNGTVSPVYGLPVFIQWQGNRYVVVERDTMRYSNWADYSAYVPRHASTHEFSGSAGDVVFVSQQQFLPLMPMPSGSLGNRNIAINEYNLMTATGTFQYFPLQATQNLTVWNPTSPTGAVMVLVALDATNGNLVYTVGSGSVFYNGLTGVADVLPKIPSVTDIGRYLPLAGVRLVSTTTRITWDNIYDVRPIYGATRAVTAPGGGGGGISTVSGTGPLVFDEGILLGTGTQFNFVGAGVTATISGTNVRINIPLGGGGGSSGSLLLDGSNSPVYGPVLFQNDAGGFGAGFHKEPIYVFASGAFGGLTIEKRWVPPSTQYQGALYVQAYDTRDETAFLYRRKITDINPTVTISEDELHTGSPITSSNPVLYVNRFNYSTNGNYRIPAILVQLNNNVDAGGAFGMMDGSFNHLWRVSPHFTGTPFSRDYPFSTVTAAPYFSDTKSSITLPTGSALQIWNYKGETEYWMTRDGRFAVNQVMVRERPTGGGTSTHPTGSFSMGVATLVGGTATIRSTVVTASSRIFLTIQNGSGTNIGTPYVVDRLAGSGFTIMSTTLLDNSQVAWWLIEPV